MYYGKRSKGHNALCQVTPTSQFVGMAVMKQALRGPTPDEVAKAREFYAATLKHNEKTSDVCQSARQKFLQALEVLNAKVSRINVRSSVQMGADGRAAH